MAEQKGDVLNIFKPGFGDPVLTALCLCGETFAEHEKPATETSWDVCSFPCMRCDCTEFRSSTVQGCARRSSVNLRSLDVI